MQESLERRPNVTDQAKSAALRTWLPGIDIADVGRVKLNENQSPPELAQRLQTALTQNPEYVQRMFELPAARHFWSEAQRARISDKAANFGR